MLRQIGDGFYSKKQLATNLHQRKRANVSKPKPKKPAETAMKPLQEGNSSHHLFTRTEIRAALVQVFGPPKTDGEHEWLHKEVERIHKRLPQYQIGERLHRSIHGITKKKPKAHLDEFNRLCASIERYEQADAADVDDTEYEEVMRRYEELRRQGYGPQPHHLDTEI